MNNNQPKITGFQTDADRLLSYLTGEIEENSLLPSELKKLEEVITMKSLLLEHKRVSKAIEIWKADTCKSDSSAYRCLNLCNAIFGKILAVSRDLKRAIAEEMINYDREIATAEKDAIALTRSTANFIKLHGLDREDGDLPDLKHFDAHTILVAILPEQVGINPPPDEELLSRIKGFYSKNAEDIDHEEA